MNEKPLSQAQSKFVVEWLRQEYKLEIPDKLTFWNQRPTTVSNRVSRDWNLVVTPRQIEAAARIIEN